MIRVTTDVFCDSCGNWEHGITSHKAYATAARKNVKSGGWYSYRGLDYCPQCVSDHSHIRDMEDKLG